MKEKPGGFQRSLRLCLKNKQTNQQTNKPTNQPRTVGITNGRVCLHSMCKAPCFTPTPCAHTQKEGEKKTDLLLTDPQQKKYSRAVSKRKTSNPTWKYNDTERAKGEPDVVLPACNPRHSGHGRQGAFAFGAAWTELARSCLKSRMQTKAAGDMARVVACLPGKLKARIQSPDMSVFWGLNTRIIKMHDSRDRSANGVHLRLQYCPQCDESTNLHWTRMSQK
jgi:hypothetical protein